MMYEGFPTLRLIEGEKLYERYKGMRDLAALKTYVEGGYVLPLLMN